MENLNDVELFREKSRFFLGRVKVQIASLEFNRNIQLHERAHVDKLVSVFRGEACNRLDPWNHVPVVVSRDTLSTRLRLAGLRNEDLIREGEPPLLEFTTPLRVLHGRRRLLAAEEYLWDKWWVAELYSNDLPARLKTSICEQYSHSGPFCDGDIYRHILKYQREGNIDEEEKWTRRLSNSKTLNLRQLRSKYRRLANGFDELTPFVGIWYQLHLGCLSRLLPDKTPEEFLHYLERMRNQYRTIMGTEEPFLLDPKTVYSLETMFPQYSTSDADSIKKLMNDGLIFPAVSSHDRRQKLLDNILGVEGRILSFHTFFQDTIYFGACSKILRKLLRPKFQGTVRQAFFESYQQGLNGGMIRLQSHGERMCDRPGTEAVHVQLAYRQLYLAAMRDFPLYLTLMPLWDNKKTPPVVPGSSAERWHQIASLAFILGFRSNVINNLMEGGDDREIMAREFLTNIRPRELYTIDEARMNRLVQYIARQLDDIATPRVVRQEAEFTTNLEGLAKEQRCNRPFHSAYRHDRDFLYMNIIYGARIRARAFVTSLAIQRDIFICFLGIIPFDDLDVPDSDDEVIDQPPHNTPPANLDESEDPREPASTDDPEDSDEAGSFESAIPNEESIIETLEHVRAEKPVILFIWHENTSYRFTEQQKEIFEEKVCELADSGYRFICIDETNQIVTESIHELWEKALNKKLVVACPKVNAENPAESDIAVLHFNSYFNIT